MPGCPKWYNSIPVIRSSLCLRILYITQLNLNHNRVRPDLIRCLTDRWFRALAAAFSSRHPHCTFEGIWHTPKHIKTKPFLGSSIHSLKWKPVTYWRLGNPFICQVWVFCLHAWNGFLILLGHNGICLLKMFSPWRKLQSTFKLDMFLNSWLEKMWQTQVKTVLIDIKSHPGWLQFPFLTWAQAYTLIPYIYICICTFQEHGNNKKYIIKVHNALMNWGKKGLQWHTGNTL